jgi:hypothetical protein
MDLTTEANYGFKKTLVISHQCFYFFSGSLNAVANEYGAKFIL